MTDFYSTMREQFDKVWDSAEYKARRQKMERHLKEYRGEWWNQSNLKANDSKVFANFLFATVQSIVPLLTDNKPIWYARAREPHKQGAMEMWRLAGEYLWDKLDCDNKLYQVMQDACLWPVGLWKLYWDVDEDELAIDVDDPRTFVIAPGYDDLWGCAWCGTKTSRPMTWVKSMYPDAFDMVEPDSGGEKAKSDPELEGQYVTVYEVWIKDEEIEDVLEGDDEWLGGIKIKEKTPAKREKYPNGRIVVMTNTVTLEDKESPFNHGRPPWIPFYDYRVPHDFWGMGEGDQIEELNRELNFRLQTLASHAQRTQKPNYLLDVSCGLDPDVVKEGIDTGGNIWAVNSGYLDNALKSVEEARINEIHIQLVSMIPQIMEEVTGVTDISKGMAAKKERQSASEVSILIESSYTRTRQRVRNLEWSLRRAYYLILELMQQFYTEPRPFRFTEGDGNVGWAYASNSPQMALEATKPRQYPQEPDEQYQMRVNQDQDYVRLLEELAENPDNVYTKFDIEIQTNSSLPVDKQAQANLMLKLATVRPQPDSVVDAEAVLDALHLPKEEIMKRKQRQMQQMMAMKGAQNAASGPATSGEQVNPQPGGRFDDGAGRPNPG